LPENRNAQETKNGGVLNFQYLTLDSLQLTVLIFGMTTRRRLNPLMACALAVIAGVAAVAAGGCHVTAAPAVSTFQNRLVRITPEIQRQAQINVLKSFAVAKERQSMELAAEAGEKISPEYQRYFAAATNGNSKTILAMFDSFKHRHRQYSNSTNAPDPSLDTAYWQPVLELCLAYQMVAECEPKYTSLFANGIIRSIPPGGIYFGGTDPGRGLPAAFCKNHAQGVPFFTLTQNALADGAYLRYLRAMYGKSLYIPSDEDSQLCFNEYLYGAQRRLKERKLRPDEDVKMQANGQVRVSGVGAVMGINGLLVETIFDKNPGREFFIEESYPLDWMYPYLKPHGLIMQIQRRPMTALPEQIVSDDRKYWQPLVDQMIGSWLRDDTLLVHVTEFSRKIYVEKDLTRFTGDPLFVHNEDAARAFSKLRSAIAGLYAWRVGALINVPTPPEYLATDAAERESMSAEADYAFRQAFALCPYSAEVAVRYTYFLAKQDRKADALMFAETAQRIQSSIGDADPKLNDLIDRLKERTLIDPVVQSAR
jgi:hypothetical protein